MINKKLPLSLLLTALLTASSAPQALACTGSDGVPDFNCDGSVTISILGDSFVAGIGDKPGGIKNGRGGYVGRMSRSFPNVTFKNMGEPGLMAQELLRKVSKSLKRRSPEAMYESLKQSDVIVLDIGRNDRWLFGEPKETYGKLVRTCSKIVKHIESVEGVAPLCVTSVLMLPNRGSQGPWVAELNKLILSGNRVSRPADLRFDKVSKRLLGSDQIHPTSQGYNALAKVFKSYIKRKLPRKYRVLRPDTDNDSVPDIIETTKLGTDPLLFDTDGDGISDSAQLFTPVP